MGGGDHNPAQDPAPRRLRGGWFAQQAGGRYTLARRWPPAWDVDATSDFPPVNPGRLARQIRQDLWRVLQGLRGFAPVVEVASTESGLSVRAGGSVLGRAPAGTSGRIQDLLDDPARRARWIRWAGQRP